jgi:hypothetical protein
MEKVITYKEYMADSGKLFWTYYLQFATPLTFKLVEDRIGLDVLMASTDEYLNDIPLRKWDALNAAVRESADKAALRQAQGVEPPKYHWSLSDGVCIAKAVARAIIKRTTYEAERAICDKAEAYAERIMSEGGKYRLRGYLTKEEAAHPDYAACNNDMHAFGAGITRAGLQAPECA